jgi:3-methyladenine DNA glycosylase AlkC
MHNKRKNSPTLLKQNNQRDIALIANNCMSTGKRIKNDEEQNSLYREFLKNVQKDKEKYIKKPQTSKTMNVTNKNPENAYRTFGIWRFKNKNILKKIKYQNTINEENLNNHMLNQKLNIDIVNPNTLKKNNSALNNKYGKNNTNIDTISPYNAISDDDKYNDTGIEDFNYDKYDDSRGNRKYVFSTGKFDKKIKLNQWKNDPFNPYLTNWQNSFLKIGYNVGFHYNKLKEGVPLLRIQKLRKKVVLPPLYKIKYNKFTEKNYDNDEDDVSKIVCSKVAQKVSSNLYSCHTINAKNSFIFCDKEKNEDHSNNY